MAATAPISGIRSKWRGWSARFAALQRREKQMVIGAALFAILFGGYTFWIEPAQMQSTRLQKTLEQQRAELAQLQTQLAAMKLSADPDAGNRALLAQLEQELVATERDIRGFDRVLVPPSQAPALLQSLLARHRGLSLVSLTTLAPQPLVAPAAPKRGEAAQPGADGAEAAALPGGNIYKHGIEIKLAGGYHDLLAYVGELEGGKQKLLWGAMKLAVQKYPVSELTLTVYTLSLESAWLVV
jgi:MSHA biogenesis protein MshJ